ncbi:MAG: virulence factor [Gammaproteobacteria bacterium]|nr:virulence factor [Gammaproteobacteria bacterium]MDA8014182.1 virulence factor [Gammaproteobacteria bacterium]
MPSPKIITVYWRAIPAQVIAKRGRESVKAQLSQRFHDAIDRAAMRAGKGSSDAYLADWKRVNAECGEDLQAEVDAAAARLESEYDDARLLALIRNKGDEPDA